MQIQKGVSCGKCQKCALVAKKYAKENRKGIFDLLLETNKELKKKKYPGAMLWLVGSSRRGMVYIKSKNDTEFDHDIQYAFASTSNPISEHTKGLRNNFIECLQRSWPNDGNTWKTENSTSVITIKKSKNGKLNASFDIALIDLVKNTIHKNVKGKSGLEEEIWNELGNVNQAYKDAKEIDLKELKNSYLKLKHNYKDWKGGKDDPDYKTSSQLFIEAVNNTSKEAK